MAKPRYTKGTPPTRQETPGDVGPCSCPACDRSAPDYVPADPVTFDQATAQKWADAVDQVRRDVWGDGPFPSTPSFQTVASRRVAYENTLHLVREDG